MRHALLMAAMQAIATTPTTLAEPDPESTAPTDANVGSSDPCAGLTRAERRRQQRMERKKEKRKS